MNSPLHIDLEAWSDAEYSEPVAVIFDDQPQDFSTWTEFALLFVDSPLATQALFSGSVDASTPGTLILGITMADLGAQFPAGEKKIEKEFPYVLRVKPGTSYRIRLMYGKLVLHRGLP